MPPDEAIAPAAPASPAAVSPGAPAVAPPPAPGAVPGETPEAEPSKPATARDYAALEKAKFDFRQAKRAATAEVAKATAEVADLKAQLEEATKGTAEAKELRAELEQAKKNGLAYAVKHGASAEELIKAYIGETSPEKQLAAMADQLKTVEERAEAKAKAAIDADKAERAEAEKVARAANIERAEAAQVESIVRTLTTVPDGETSKTPYLLSEYEPAEIAAQVKAIQVFANSVQKRYEFEEVRDYLESRAKKVHDERAGRRAKLLAQQAVEASPGGAKGVAPPKGAPAIVPAAGNGRRTAGPESRKDPPPKLTRLQQLDLERAEDLARLAAARAKDAAAHR